MKRRLGNRPGRSMQIDIQDHPAYGLEQYNKLPTTLKEELDSFSAVYGGHVHYSQQGFLLQKAIETDLVSVLCCRYNLGGVTTFAYINNILQKGCIIACLDGHLSVTASCCIQVQEYRSGYAGYIESDGKASALDGQFHLNLGEGSGVFMVFAIKPAFIDRLAREHAFWFEVFQCQGVHYPEHPSRLDDRLYLAPLREIEDVRYDRGMIDPAVWALAVEISDVEKYRDAVSPNLSLFPGLSQPNDFAFQWALTHASKDGINYLPRYFPGYEYGVPEAHYRENDRVAMELFGEFTRKLLAKAGKRKESIPLLVIFEERRFKHGDPAVMAQVHRWFAWWIANRLEYDPAYAILGSRGLMKLGDVQTEKLLRAVIEQPRSANTDAYYDTEFASKKWRIWEDDTGAYHGSPRGFIDLVILLQDFPKAIELFMFNTSVKIAWASEREQEEKLERWFSQAAMFPLTVFFLKDAKKRRMLVRKRVMDRAGGQQTPAEIKQQTDDYIFDACRCMLVYCANLEFSPVAVIAKLMNEFKVGFSEDTLIAQHGMDMESRTFWRRGTVMNSRQLSTLS